MKYLVLVAFLAVAYLLWRSQQRRAQASSRPDPARPSPSRSDATSPQDMVSCPVCAVHLPRSEAVADPQGRLYCSPEHRAGAPR